MVFHFQPRDRRANLIEDINEWLREVTGDKNEGLSPNNRMTTRELETILYAIAKSKEAKGK